MKRRYFKCKVLRMRKIETIKLVVSDLDGTLLTKDCYLSEENLKAIQALKKAGILFGIATGRPHFSIGPLLPLWKLEGLVDVIIANNGYEIEVCSTQHFLYGVKLSLASLRQIIDEYQDLPGNFCLYQKDALYGQVMDDFMLRVSKKNHLPAYEVDLKNFVQEDVEKLLLACDPKDLDQIEAFYSQHLNPNYRGFKSQAYLFEFMHPSVSKLKGLQDYCLYSGIDIEEVVAFGDNLNDLEMIQGSGFGVVMSNGDPLVKDHADHIAPHHDEHGFAQVVQSLLK